MTQPLTLVPLSQVLVVLVLTILIVLKMRSRSQKIGLAADLAGSSAPASDLPAMTAPSATEEAIENPLAGGMSLVIDGVNKDAVPLKMGKLRKLGGEHPGNAKRIVLAPLPTLERMHVHSFVFGSQAFYKVLTPIISTVCCQAKTKTRGRSRCSR